MFLGSNFNFSNPNMMMPRFGQFALAPYALPGMSQPMPASPGMVPQFRSPIANYRPSIPQPQPQAPAAGLLNTPARARDTSLDGTIFSRGRRGGGR